MGWDTKMLSVHARVSNHGSDQDRKDEADWNEFVCRVKAIAREHRYNDIDIDVMGGGTDEC